MRFMNLNDVQMSRSQLCCLFVREVYFHREKERIPKMKMGITEE